LNVAGDYRLIADSAFPNQGAVASLLFSLMENDILHELSGEECGNQSFWMPIFVVLGKLLNGNWNPNRTFCKASSER